MNGVKGLGIRAAVGLATFSLVAVGAMGPAQAAESGNAISASDMPSSLVDCPKLSEGDESGCVQLLQIELDAINSGYNLQQDSKFGPATRIAVLDFQGRNHLGADGIVGPATESELQRQFDQVSVPTPTRGAPELTPMQVCEAIGGEGWIPDHDGGCDPDGAIPLGRAPWDCAQDALGKKVVEEFKKKWAEEGAEAAAKAGTAEGAKSLAKKLAAAGGIFKCILWDSPDS